MICYLLFMSKSACGQPSRDLLEFEVQTVLIRFKEELLGHVMGPIPLGTFIWRLNSIDTEVACALGLRSKTPGSLNPKP